MVQKRDDSRSATFFSRRRERERDSERLSEIEREREEEMSEPLWARVNILTPMSMATGVR